MDNPEGLAIHDDGTVIVAIDHPGGHGALWEFPPLPDPDDVGQGA
jgi:hypothetical protein